MDNKQQRRQPDQFKQNELSLTILRACSRSDNTGVIAAKAPSLVHQDRQTKAMQTRV